ncbi:MAG: V-type ATP synthase subunit D [Bacteroidales bacterium]|nr:V-type ATP synthase subunit D [Bacteroidales bacterium]
MAIKFQYNKTCLQDLKKQLKIRVDVLPIIKNKESALRMEVKRAKNQARSLDKALKSKMQEYDNIVRLWGEFDENLLRIDDVKISIKKIAGVNTPVLEDIIFSTQNFSLFNKPEWFLDGISILKDLAKIGIEKNFYFRKMDLLLYARRKTTQKVNLYEKIQIPGYEEAIMKIKRFMEDEENLSKSAQKILKKRQEEREAA